MNRSFAPSLRRVVVTLAVVALPLAAAACTEVPQRAPNSANDAEHGMTPRMDREPMAHAR